MRPLQLMRAAALLGLWAATLAHAGEAMDGVKARGELRCGVSEGIAGFSAKDAGGRWTGLDADFCRAVAAAVLGDPAKVKFVPLRSSTRFPALQAGKIDLLVRNTTWTLTREAMLGLQFPAVLFYDGQGFLVPVSAGLTSSKELAGATICVEKGTTHERNLRLYFGRRGMAYTPLVIDSAREVAQALFDGRCQAYSSDASQLAAARLWAADPRAYQILPERISKEPLGPVVWGGDPQWTTAVRWVLYGLLLADEHGIDQALAANPPAEVYGELIPWSEAEEVALAKALGMPAGWALRAVQAVGNYGELFERNLGAGSPLGIERGLNRLWTQGGLMYAPPIK
ncbi:MAG: amino acid ABC transporter substrate-binding protein [Chromatiaceae bacterium]|jgi:general L-amino acid transport system substrate-binding protein|nr:amino acid ABC transporter substrate-binding protein [Chromatiaceae bacterium]